jgi:transcriptional regulator with XRE-family HTH domain
MERIKELAKEKGFNLKGLAENRLKISYRTFINRLERGYYDKSYNDIKEVLQALGCEFEELEQPKGKEYKEVEEDFNPNTEEERVSSSIEGTGIRRG